MVSYIFVHPKREKTVFGEYTIYHDAFSHNQCPYIWNKQFLHSYCKITDYSYNQSKEGEYIFWVSLPKDNSQKCLCDLVFKVKTQEFWYNNILEQREAIRNNHHLSVDDAIVDNEQAFEDHYVWVEKGQHVWREECNRRRLTLKADEELSFQPQDGNGELLDISNILKEIGIDIQNDLERNARNGYKPIKIEDKCQAKELYDNIKNNAAQKLYGKDLEIIRKELKLKESKQ
ncbi:hypothetical protein MUA26_00440 [Staphylococcus sp. IVB6246]|uniref:hypothetical protein n=1 Tax=Staphylococcus sp. IVB6246 TaxID=2989772 RepID=UPI0021D3D7B7|nr:hypothetical protein [Staphylococcus sp. IVB6246]UXR69680.1 hypothetical protein MUA26_00440 [Staphylococcus sp. IVB6246]